MGRAGCNLSFGGLRFESLFRILCSRQQLEMVSLGFLSVRRGDLNLP